MAIQLVVVGAAGRMGKRIIALAVESGDFEICGAVEAPGHGELGKDAGLAAGTKALGVKLTETYPAGAEVVIEFSLPEAVPATLDYCTKHQAALVSGTTGLSSEQRAAIEAASGKIPVIYGTNMSVGMNILFGLAGKVAATLGDQYDIEIIEQHHRFKKDAPSGSALTLAENICKATGRGFPGCLTHGRSGKAGPREKGTIGMHAVRAGDITGVHSVIFGALGETVTISHTANNRDTFVRGALRAAKWLVDKQPGLYSMAEVLGVS